MTQPVVAAPEHPRFQFWRHAFRPALWPLGVTVCCVIAGFRVGNSEWPRAEQFLEMICYVLLLVPIHANRQALYEGKDLRLVLQDDLSARQHRAQSAQLLFLPLVFAILLIIALLLCYQRALRTVVDSTLLLTLPHIGLAPSGIAVISNQLASHVARLTWDALGTVAAGLAPFYILQSAITYLWPGSDALCFRWRSVFPWLLTVSVSFMLGWSVGRSVGALLFMDLFLIALLAGVMGPRRADRGATLVPLRNRPPRVGDAGFAKVAISGFAFLLLCTMGASLFAPLAPWRTALQACLLGVILSCGVLVTDAWRLAAMSRDDAYGPYFDSARLAIDKYLPGANLATAAALPLLLFSSLHPATGRLYFLGVCLATAAIGALWCIDGGERADRYGPWVWRSAVASMILPALVGLTVRLQAGMASEVRPEAFDWTAGIGFYALSVGVALPVLKARYREDPAHRLQDLLKGRPIQAGSRIDCVFLLAAMCLLLIVGCGSGLALLWAGVRLLHWFSASEPMTFLAWRLTAVLVAYDVGALVLWVIVTIHEHRSRPQSGDNLAETD